MILLVFVIGYLAIALEHPLRINKAATALLLGVVCWTLFALDIEHLQPLSSIPEWFRTLHAHASDGEIVRAYAIEGKLLEKTGEIAGILFFLMGAMTIVELVDAHEGFQIVTNRITARKTVTLLWLIGWLSFFVSAVLDNLTTTIVMISLLRKLVKDRETRMMFAGIVIIAANAGGAWTVIGDVTTTMIWMKEKISPIEVMKEVFLPSVICLLVPLIALSYRLKGNLEPTETKDEPKVDSSIKPWHQVLFLLLGLGALLSVPIFKTMTHLPPYLGMLLGLSVLWIVSEFVGHTMDEGTRSTTGVLAVLKRVDMSSILFFLGILLAVDALGAVGILQNAALWLDENVKNHSLVATFIGLLSAVVDNVPLVAAGLEMYSLPLNDPFWMLLAFCAGTGGSCLIIGSAAGVAAMGLENIHFFWYVRKISPWALLGYFAGTGALVLQQYLMK